MRGINPYSFWRLLWRSLLPSTASFIASSVVALVLIGTHLLLLGANAGVLLPNVLDSLGNSWAGSSSSQPMAVSNHIMSAIHNPTFNTALIAAIWGFFGWVLYETIRLIVDGLRSIRTSQKAVYVPDGAHIASHPLRRALLVRLLWRACVTLLAVLATVLLEPVLEAIWRWDQEMIRAVSLRDLLELVGRAFLAWLLILHVGTVILRLFVFRTRVYGEVID